MMRFVRWIYHAKGNNMRNVSWDIAINTATVWGKTINRLFIGIVKRQSKGMPMHRMC